MSIAQVARPVSRTANTAGTLKPVPAVSLNALASIFDRQVLHGIPYGFGAKAKTLSMLPEKIQAIDCSGEVRYLLAQGSKQNLIIPDGSVTQREWCEDRLRQVDYLDLPMADPSRLFIAFITPFINGCGRVGHVWLVGKFDSDWSPDTLESYGGRGVGSRNWNNRTLMRMVHKCFELPTMA